MSASSAPAELPEAARTSFREWVETRRETTVIEQIDHCIKLTALAPDLSKAANDARRQRGVACYQEAARLLELGIEYQKCQWGEPSNVQCAPLGAEVLAPEPNAQAELVEQAEKLRVILAEVTPRGVDALPDKVRLRREEVSRIIARYRGQATLVSQGGVSLGSWQAGLLYLMTEWQKQRTKRLYDQQVAVLGGASPKLNALRQTGAFSTVTGASAGAVNGLVAALESCRWLDATPPAPDGSLYYKIWVNSLGLFGRNGRAGLFPTDDMPSDELGIFNKGGALKVALDEAASNLAEGRSRTIDQCAVDFGFSVTHLNLNQTPVLVEATGGDTDLPVLSRSTLRKKFAVRLKMSSSCASQGEPDDGEAVRRAQGNVCINNIEPGVGGDALLPLPQRAFYAGLGSDPDQVPLHWLLRGVTASGAFPVAFPPVELPFTQYVPKADGTFSAEQKRATFVDGGTLDNTPFGLAAAIDDWRPRPSSNPYLHDLLPGDPKTYIFVDPNVTSWQPREPTPEAEKNGGVITTLLNFAGGFVSSSSDAEFLDNAQKLPFMRRLKQDWVGSRLALPRRRMPIAGALVGHFMAFLEKDFRVYDFYVGLADAFIHLREEERLLYGASPLVDGLDKDLRQKDPLYRCMRAYYERYGLASAEPNPTLTGGIPQRAMLLSQAALPRECRLEASGQAGGTAPAAAWPLSEEEAGLIDAGKWPAYDDLLDAVAEGRPTNAESERKLAAYNFRALLVTMHNFKIWTQALEYDPDEEFEEFFQLAGTAPATACDAPAACKEGGFVFLDLAAWNRGHQLVTVGGRMSAAEAKSAFRQLAQEAINHFSDVQPGLSKDLLRIAGRPAVDAVIQRSYPSAVVGLGFVERGIEASVGVGLTDATAVHLRWDVLGARIFRLEAQELDRGFAPFHLTASAFTRVALVVPINDFIDGELGATANVEQVWAPTAPRHAPWPGGGFGFGGTLAATLAQRVYLGIEYQYRPESLTWTDPAFRNTAALLLRRHEIATFLGWRWLW